MEVRAESTASSDPWALAKRIDFAARVINKATVRTPHRGEFMEGAQNVVMIGGPGTGKSHVATALGIQDIEHHRKRVRFFSTVELVNALEQERARARPGRSQRRW